MRFKGSLLLVILLVFSVFVMGEITVSVVACSDNADSLKWLAEEFMKRNPDIKVEVTTLSWEVLYPRILADISAKTGAFDVFNWDVMTAGAVSKGCVDLFEFMKENPDLVDPNYDMDDLLPLAKNLGIWDGKLVGFPQEIEEAAYIDGASRMQSFIHVVLPLSAPGLAAAAILAFIQSWGEFLLALILTNNASAQTLPVYLGRYITGWRVAWGPLSAAGLVTMLPVIIFALIFQRYLMRGLTLGAVK